MKVYGIQQNNNNIHFQSAVKIRKNDNLAHTYLYNEIIKLTNEYKIPATFRNKEIELPAVSKCILQKLNELKIIFINNK